MYSPVVNDSCLCSESAQSKIIFARSDLESIKVHFASDMFNHRVATVSECDQIGQFLKVSWRHI